MQGSTVRFVLALTTLLLLLVIASHVAEGNSPQTSAAADEVARVREHLDNVAKELATADVAHLSMEQRRARTHHLNVLREYLEQGPFPHNHVVRNARVPVFVDEHGTHCAVGYLIARSGRADIVEHIAGTRNLATVHELAADPELAAWLDGAGFTVDEAARIQPWYGPIPEPEPQGGSRAYTTATLVATGLGGSMIAWNLIGDNASNARVLRGTLGLAVGMGEIALGSIGVVLDSETSRDVEPAHIAINFGVGLVSSALGVRSLLRREPSGLPAADNGAPEAQAHGKEGPQWNLAAWTRNGGVGARVQMRF